MTHAVVEPGGTLGVLGSGQLGRMFTIAARRMGYRVHVLSPDDDTPTGQVADLEVNANYDDLDTVDVFARNVDVVTFEFENVPLATIEQVEKHAAVRPAGSVLHTTQDRLREKTYLQQFGFPVTPFVAIRGDEDVTAVPADFFPSVLKTSRWGYDGKGQQRVNGVDELVIAWHACKPGEAILERFVAFQRELSVVVVRDQSEHCVVYDPFENHHVNHILDVTVSPAHVPSKLRTEAMEIGRSVVESLDAVGVICIEFFVTHDGHLLINELAPRPHNSGHLTIDAHVSCQFEQQVRSVTGLPLGSPHQLRSAAMANLLGDVWQPGRPDWKAACKNPNIKLHLYGKQEPRLGRKMGHLTATADTPEKARQHVLEARTRLLPV